MGEHKHKKDSQKSSKREHKESSGKEHKKHKKSSHNESSKNKHEMEIDYSDPSLWVEAGGTNTAEVTPSEQLKYQQQANEAREEAALKDDMSFPKEESRHGWMLDGGMDFGAMGTARIKENEKPKPNPDDIKVSDRELNPYLKKGIKFEDYPEEKKPSIKFGDAGSNWRMMKLRRSKEQAEDEGRSVREVGIEKYGSIEKFEEALAEREYLDNRKSRDNRGRHGEEQERRSDRNYDRRDRKNDNREESRRYMFTDTDAKQNTFKRPEPPKMKRSFTPPVQATVPTPSAPLIQHIVPQSIVPVVQALTRDQLNKLKAKIVKAKLMGIGDIDALEKEFENELKSFEQAERREASGEVTVLPQLDSHGRMYDYALKQGDQERETLKGKKKYEGTHDKTTGERIRYGTSDDTLSLAEMVRQEKAGSKSSNMDMEFANRIMNDTTFEDSHDYMDEKADIMAAKKGVTEKQKMIRAVTDHKRTQETLSRCRFCYQDGNPPQVAMISLGTTCYLALPNVLELTPGSCVIVPLQHVSSMLECDDDVWTEVRNFQKCLMKMFHEQGKGVVFMETVINLRQQRHAVIEATPVPYDTYEDAPAYFKEAIYQCEEEWSQHKKLIDTTDKGFRNSMVKNLPYFHVWFGLDKSYGHVIEDPKEFPSWFGKEIIAGMMDIGPELWRKPRYHYQNENYQRQQEFLKTWDKWDWTKALQ